MPMNFHGHLGVIEGTFVNRVGLRPERRRERCAHERAPDADDGQVLFTLR
jgi:hypothetical protein